MKRLTKKDFLKLPHRSWDQSVECDSIVIIPTRRKHDSGYMCMDFAAMVGDKPICLLSGCSDVIHIEGIGGLGDDWLNKFGGIPEKVRPSEWSIDCLPCGLLRIFTRNGMKCGPALSSFEIFSKEKK